jgi:hypothetical protein
MFGVIYTKIMRTFIRSLSLRLKLRAPFRAPDTGSQMQFRRLVGSAEHWKISASVHPRFRTSGPAKKVRGWALRRFLGAREDHFGFFTLRVTANDTALCRARRCGQG